VVVGSSTDETCQRRAEQLLQQVATDQVQVLMDTALWPAEGDVVPAIAAAILAMLYQDQTPGNVPALTGAGAPRVLGQLTPGNLLAWNQLQRDLAFARPPIAPLRAAI
jgi:1,6-anhydro-N-acetylmuramate kinase